jgi:hypothetical protein
MKNTVYFIAISCLSLPIILTAFYTFTEDYINYQYLWLLITILILLNVR